MSSEPIHLSTNLTQTGVVLNINSAQKNKIRTFINEKFPKGYAGIVEMSLGEGTSFKIPLSINTIDTLKASGKKIQIQDLSSINSK
ncbi:MAG: hypothetical protein NTX25_18345 [Proteobacteria bacterium]|nr:hypothetical protein [Pseudomonadota bacterium]